MSVPVATIVEASAAGLGAVALGAGVLFKKGKQEQQIQDQMAALTEATGKNTAAIEKLSDAMMGFKDIMVNELADLKTRVTVLEKIQARS